MTNFTIGRIFKSQRNLSDKLNNKNKKLLQLISMRLLSNSRVACKNLLLTFKLLSASSQMVMTFLLLRYDEKKKSMDHGYPRKIVSDFGNIGRVDAAFQKDGE